jgi:LPXTG-motif cell wall-anchored protein
MPLPQKGLVMAESPVPGALREQLARWTAVGLIDSDQADRIEAAERERAAALPRRRLPLVTEVLGYVGAVIAITAIVVTVHQIWKHVPAAVELATAGAIAVGLLLAGAALRTDSDLALARLRSVLWLFSTAGAAAFVAVLTRRYLHLVYLDVTLATAAAWLVCALPLWWRTRSPLQHLAAFGGAVTLLETGMDRIDPHAGTFASGLALWVLALAWGIAVSRGLLVPAPIGMVLSGAGVLTGAIVAMDHTAGVPLAVATVAGLFAAGVLLHRVPLIGIGAVGTLYVIPDAANEYLPGSVAAPLAVAVVGLVLLGVALWLARRRRKSLRESVDGEPGHLHAL